MITLADLLRATRKHAPENDVDQDWFFMIQGEEELDAALKKGRVKTNGKPINTGVLSAILSAIQQLTREKNVLLDPLQESKLAAFAYSQYLNTGQAPDREVLAALVSYTAMNGHSGD